MKKLSNLKTRLSYFFVKVKKFLSSVKMPGLGLIVLLGYFFLSVFWFNKDLMEYILSQILNLGSHQFNTYWGEKIGFLFLKKSLYFLNKIMVSFSVLFFVLYRYLKKYPEMQKKYLNPHVFDLLGLCYGFIYFNFVILGTVLLLNLNLEYRILGLLSVQGLESYTYFASYQTVFGLISVNSFFILFFLLLNWVALKLLVYLVDNFLL